MDLRVRGLYKRLLYLCKDYPKGGLDSARPKLKAAFRAPTEEPLEKSLAKGDFVARELEALIYLHKYRALFNRYTQPEANKPRPPSRPGSPGGFSSGGRSYP